MGSGKRMGTARFRGAYDRITTMIDDLRLATRLLLKDKAFTLTAALTLAICIGANTTLFSVVHNVLLAPLPVPESDRILLMSTDYPKAGADGLGNSGAP